MSGEYTDTGQNKFIFVPKMFDQTFFFCQNILFGETSFGKTSFGELRLAKLYLAWIGCANPFPDFARFSTGYATEKMLQTHTQTNTQMWRNII